MFAWASSMGQNNPEQDMQPASGNKDTYFLLGMLPIIVGVPQGLLFLLFWNWFVKPLGLPGIGYWQAFGLMLFISTIRYQERKIDSDNKDNGSKWFAPLRRHYSNYLVFLLLGWVAHLLMRWGM